MAGLTIGKFAAAEGVGVETVRFYQRRGLLALPERRGSGYREYTEADRLRGRQADLVLRPGPLAVSPAGGRSAGRSAGLIQRAAPAASLGIIGV
jgi:MerR family regulatory protein